MPIARKKRGELLSMSFKKKIKIKKHTLVTKKAIDQESPLSKSLSRIGLFKYSVKINNNSSIIKVFSHLKSMNKP
jgi:hypothetical protein